MSKFVITMYRFFTIQKRPILPDLLEDIHKSVNDKYEFGFFYGEIPEWWIIADEAFTNYWVLTQPGIKEKSNAEYIDFWQRTKGFSFIGNQKFATSL